MKGRPADWLAANDGGSLETLVSRAARDGFAGVYIDRFGYADRGAELESDLSRLLGARPLVSPNRRMAFFELPPSTQALD